ncbi:MAG: hypothetical protein IJJ33_01795, partial [Victivallales bacterium]|nr:hypothetical protein [Victivallales bacterium]
CGAGGDCVVGGGRTPAPCGAVAEQRGAEPAPAPRNLSTCTVAGGNKGVSPLGGTVPDSNRRIGFVLVFQGRDALVTPCNRTAGNLFARLRCRGLL